MSRVMSQANPGLAGTCVLARFARSRLQRLMVRPLELRPRQYPYATRIAAAVDNSHLLFLDETME